MVDNGNRVRILPGEGGFTLNPLLRVLDGMFIGGRGDALALDTNIQPGLVHHPEHDLHAGLFLTEELADTVAVLAKIQRRRGRRPDTHLVFEVPRGDIVWFPQASVIVDTNLGNDKDRDALRSGKITLDPCQDGMDDIFRQVVIA
ncbi:hypothetical protein ES708_30096 [subsurface metagenome]